VAIRAWVLNETTCLPCLLPNCVKQHAKTHHTSEDPCTLCFDDLCQGPCIALKCEHVFHYECLMKSLAKGWPSARISFQYITCAQCKREIEPLFEGQGDLFTDQEFKTSMKDTLERAHQLRGVVQNLSFTRLEFEGELNNSHIITPGQPFYNDPHGYAMSHYAFSQCFTCQKPYFVGAVECANLGEGEVNRADLRCSGCQKLSSVTCPTHDSTWLQYKCKYCCNFSVWHCFNQIHFCDTCHDYQVLSQMTEEKHGIWVNKKKNS